MLLFLSIPPFWVRLASTPGARRGASTPLTKTRFFATTTKILAMLPADEEDVISLSSLELAMTYLNASDPDFLLDQEQGALPLELTKKGKIKKNYLKTNTIAKEVPEPTDLNPHPRWGVDSENSMVAADCPRSWPDAFATSWRTIDSAHADLEVICWDEGFNIKIKKSDMSIPGPHGRLVMRQFNCFMSGTGPTLTGCLCKIKLRRRGRGNGWMILSDTGSLELKHNGHAMLDKLTLSMMPKNRGIPVIVKDLVRQLLNSDITYSYALLDSYISVTFPQFKCLKDRSWVKEDMLNFKSDVMGAKAKDFTQQSKDMLLRLNAVDEEDPYFFYRKEMATGKRVVLV